MSLDDDYRARHAEVLEPLAHALEQQIAEYLDARPRIDRISARPKGIKKFLDKAAKRNDDGSLKYEHPLAQIQDQVGARVTVFYKSDIEPISTELLKYLRPIESKDLVPSSEWEFGYFGRHHVCLFPPDLILPDWNPDHVPQFFELQVKTLFQHAWSEANHDLGYKPDTQPLTSDQLRMLAYTSAQAWGADRVFDELFEQLNPRRCK